ncbi:hypothetical protein NPIL_67641 [Nephila pilipes]|uniref:Spider venom protein n=1 Tax=Nephila pilipes TaxID=299642 RepID=A0A8X6UUQ7_NEPPI|nr:hypothetical protein NPIL_67641 [Nephila pilipes]
MNLHVALVIILPIVCNADGQVNRFNHENRFDFLFRTSEPQNTTRTPTDEKIPHNELCNGIFCQDGRCVSDIWMCNDHSTNEDLKTKNEVRNDGSSMIHYIFAVCGILVMVVLLLSCLCSAQEIETKSSDVKYTALKKIKKGTTSTSNSRNVSNSISDNQRLYPLKSDKKSEPEIQYFWGDQQELFPAESYYSDDKLIKV